MGGVGRGGSGGFGGGGGGGDGYWVAVSGMGYWNSMSISMIELYMFDSCIRSTSDCF